MNMNWKLLVLLVISQQYYVEAANDSASSNAMFCYNKGNSTTRACVDDNDWCMNVYDGFSLQEGCQQGALVKHRFSKICGTGENDIKNGTCDVVKQWCTDCPSAPPPPKAGQDQTKSVTVSPSRSQSVLCCCKDPGCNIGKMWDKTWDCPFYDAQCIWEKKYCGHCQFSSEWDATQNKFLVNKKVQSCGLTRPMCVDVYFPEVSHPTNASEERYKGGETDVIPPDPDIYYNLCQEIMHSQNESRCAMTVLKYRACKGRCPKDNGAPQLPQMLYNRPAILCCCDPTMGAVDAPSCNADPNLNAKQVFETCLKPKMPGVTVQPITGGPAAIENPTVPYAVCPAGYTGPKCDQPIGGGKIANEPAAMEPPKGPAKKAPAKKAPPAARVRPAQAR